MLSESVLTALIAGLSALAGAALANWSAARQQDRQDRMAALRERQALMRQHRAECLGWVLEARTRIEALLPRLNNQKVPSAPADKTAAVAARQAYAVALLYLVDARQPAKAFYQATVQMQLALDDPGDKLQEAIAAWRLSYEALENCLADLASREYGVASV